MPSRPPAPEPHDPGVPVTDLPRVHRLHPDDPAALAPEVRASRRAVAAARVTNTGLVNSTADAATLDAVADLLERAAALLEPHRVTSRFVHTGGMRAGPGGSPEVWETHFFLGPGSPYSPPVRVHADGDRVIALVTVPHPYEGPPGTVHGGIVSALFDIVLGSAVALNGRPGVTGTLSVRYRRPTPIGREVRYEAWVAATSERTTTARGASWCDGEVLAEGEAVFVRVPGRAWDPPASGGPDGAAPGR